MVLVVDGVQLSRLYVETPKGRTAGRANSEKVTAKQSVVNCCNIPITLKARQ